MKRKMLGKGLRLLFGDIILHFPHDCKHSDIVLHYMHLDFKDVHAKIFQHCNFSLTFTTASLQVTYVRNVNKFGSLNSFLRYDIRTRLFG